MSHKIQLTIGEDQLRKFKEEIENYGDVKVNDPLLLLQHLLQKDVDEGDVYADIKLDSGHNSIQDLLEDDQLKESCTFIDQD